MSVENLAACRDDPRFTDDPPTHWADRDALAARLSAICDACPLREACAEAAEVEKPVAAFWAGKWWTGNQVGAVSRHFRRGVFRGVGDAGAGLSA
ncbi:MAG: hypothetical protein QM621_14905 [Aeromicrobium sp.]|uniref:hypothetical protein n=1 Tax=Aeromicrobium sp. TaxID=1871063 RepID=UPI0039E49341